MSKPAKHVPEKAKPPRPTHGACNDEMCGYVAPLSEFKCYKSTETERAPATPRCPFCGFNFSKMTAAEASTLIRRRAQERADLRDQVAELGSELSNCVEISWA